LYVDCSVRRVPPHFSIPPENVEVMPGGSVNITCVAIGSPMPFVKWRLGALELTHEDNIPIGKNVLMLDNIRESATYTCVAASDLGNIESDAEVRVKGRSQWRIARNLIWGGVYVLTSHCNFKTCVNVPHVNKTVTDFGGIYTDIPPVATPLKS